MNTQRHKWHEIHHPSDHGENVVFGLENVEHDERVLLRDTGGLSYEIDHERGEDRERSVRSVRSHYDNAEAAARRFATQIERPE